MRFSMRNKYAAMNGRTRASCSAGAGAAGGGFRVEKTRKPKTGQNKHCLLS